MRLHRLRIVAFGPFPEPVEVDFDALGQAGLFLLSGPTGAGKSSVLDAVCFALYGAVPGDRNTAKHLRCDLAVPSVAPEVSLEVTLGGRRFRITRSPRWDRPVKRGQGTTKQQASVVVTERIGGLWSPLTNRMDEAGDLVGDLLGLTMTQFCQVALLPQGQFQAFLRAGSDDRRALLARLFRTARFDRVETWLRERRQVLRRESERHESVVASSLSRLAEAAGRDLPTEWDGQSLAAAAEAGELAAWSVGLRHDASLAQQQAAKAADGSATASAAAEQRHARSELITGRRERFDRARARLTDLEDEQPSVDADWELLSAGERAAAVTPSLQHRDRQRARWRSAEATATTARGNVATLSRLADDGSDDGELAVLRAQERAAQAAASRIEALLPGARRYATLAEQIAEAARDTADLELTLHDLDTELAGLPDCLTTLTASLAEAQHAAARLPGVRAEADRAREHYDAAMAAEHTRTRLAGAQAELAETQEQLLAAQEALLQLREERLSGMAAEIATSLAAGCACPVCGSSEHPTPAQPSDSAPDAAAEKAAVRALDTVKSEQVARDGAVRDLQTVLAGHVRVSGAMTSAQAYDFRVAADAEVADVTRIADSAGTLTRRLEKARTHRDQLATRREQTATRRAGLLSAVDGWRDEASEIARQIEAALADEADPTEADPTEADLTENEPTGGVVPRLSGLCERHRHAAVAWGRAAEAVAALESARQSAAEADAQASDAAVGAGFDDLNTAVAALLPMERVESLRHRIRRHEVDHAAATAALADRELAGAHEIEIVPLDRAADEREQARARLLAARADLSSAEHRSARLSQLQTGLVAALGAWEPVRSRWHEVADLSTMVEGKHPDNRWQMRLSAYVLAHRLSQVVAAANERLAGMTESRYQLEHTSERGAGETRGGLTLLVRDDWSGESRDPSTLSGGETFVVSLALALGLADVITQEAGGAGLDTLFVDEGFGSLDADTLDDVLGTLDALRSGGRVVGVVSHVAEMADRIPAQLRVSKSRSGSTLRVVAG